MNDDKTREEVWKAFNDRSGEFSAIIALKYVRRIHQAEYVDQLLRNLCCSFVLQGTQHNELRKVILVHKQPLVLPIRHALHVDQIDLATAVEVL